MPRTHKEVKKDRPAVPSLASSPLRGPSSLRICCCSGSFRFHCFQPGSSLSVLHLLLSPCLSSSWADQGPRICKVLQRVKPLPSGSWIGVCPQCQGLAEVLKLCGRRGTVKYSVSLLSMTEQV